MTSSDIDASAARSNHEFVKGLVDEIRPLPSRFDCYEDVRPLPRASGGMGDIYLAFDANLKCSVVLKLAKPEYLDRLKLEGEALARLRGHKGFVQIHRRGQYGDQHFLSIEYGGKSLRETADTFLTNVYGAATLVAKLADAMEHAHRGPILHRDLKPDNVLIGDDGEPKIIDFGLAKIMEAGRPPLTKDGVTMGTPDYMSPEQIRPNDEKPIDVGTDIYSLGVMLYELTTGDVPIKISQELPYKWAEMIWNVTPTPPQEINPRIHPNLAAITMKCLAKDPLQRYLHANDLAHDLRQLPDGPFKMRRETLREMLWRRARRHRRPLYSGLLVVLAVALGLALHFRSVDRQRERMLDMNESAARTAAQGWLKLMRVCGSDVVRHANDDTLRDRLRAWNEIAASNPDSERVVHDPRREPLQTYAAMLEATKNPEAQIENWQILDARGTIIARTPEATPRPIIGLDLETRDYFRGALAHAGLQGLSAVHVSKAYNSFADDQVKYAVSVPVTDRDGRILGVLSASTTTEPDAGDPVLRQERVLLAPRDQGMWGERPTSATSRYVVLVHPIFEHGQGAITFDSDVLPLAAPRSCGHELDDPDPTHRSRRLPSLPSLLRDPWSNEHWLAGVAAVGKTGFVALAQTPEE